MFVQVSFQTGDSHSLDFKPKAPRKPDLLCCTCEAPCVLQVVYKRLRSGGFSVCVGNSSRCNEVIVDLKFRLLMSLLSLVLLSSLLLLFCKDLCMACVTSTVVLAK